MKIGFAPAKMMADMTDLCTLRGTMILSPGEQTDKIIVMIAPLVPCTEKKVWSAPKASAASCCASIITPLVDEGHPAERC